MSISRWTARCWKPGRAREELSAKQGRPAPPPDDRRQPHSELSRRKRSNETHESKTDPEALLARKGEGKESKLSYSGNLLTVRSGLIVDAEVFQANGTAERDAALVMPEQIPGNKAKPWRMD